MTYAIVYWWKQENFITGAVEEYCATNMIYSNAKNPDFTSKIRTICPNAYNIYVGAATFGKVNSAHRFTFREI